MARIHAIAVVLDGVAACLVAGCGGSMDNEARNPPPAPCAGAVCVSTVAGSGEFGTADGPAANARFFMPHSVALDATSQLHVADFGNNSGTRLIADGRVSTLPEDEIDCAHPGDTVADAAGNTYVAEPYGNRIVKVAPDGTTSVLAGTGQPGDSDGDGASATFSMPSGLAFDAAGTLYVADMGNRKIRSITFSGAVR